MPCSNWWRYSRCKFEVVRINKLCSPLPQAWFDFKSESNCGHMLFWIWVNKFPSTRFNNSFGSRRNSIILYIIAPLCGDATHDYVMKLKHFSRYWPFVRGIHQSPVTSPHKGQWRWALMFSLICTWINGWVNNGEAGDLRRQGNICYKAGERIFSEVVNETTMTKIEVSISILSWWDFINDE